MSPRDEELAVKINRIVVVGNVTDAQIKKACTAMAEQGHQVGKPKVAHITSANFPFLRWQVMEKYASPEQMEQASLSDSEWRAIMRRWVADLGEVHAFVMDEAAWQEWPSFAGANASMSSALDDAYGAIPRWVAHPDGSVEYV